VTISSTLLELRTRVIYLADIDGQVGVGASFRHQQSFVDATINDYHRQMQSAITALGFRWYVLSGGIQTLPAAPDASENFSSTTLPADCYALQHVAAFTGGEWRLLERIDYEQLRNFNPTRLASSSYFPQAYCLMSFGPTSKIAFLPFGTGQYELLYLPQWTEVTLDAGTFHFADALHREWVLLKVAYALSGIRDGDSRGRLAAIAGALQDVDARIRAAVPKLISTGARTMTRAPSRDRRVRGW